LRKTWFRFVWIWLFTFQAKKNPFATKPAADHPKAAAEKRPLGSEAFKTPSSEPQTDSGKSGCQLIKNSRNFILWTLATDAPPINKERSEAISEDKS